MASTAAQLGYTAEEYLSRERDAEFKSEYIEGQIYAMAGGSPWHSAVAANLIAAFSRELGDKPCQVFTSDLKIGTRSSRLFAYPDLSVVCGELEFHAADPDVVTNPALIAEVLSPSTELYDRGRKFLYYRQIETLQDYLLVAQSEPAIEHYHRQAEGEWVFRTAADLDGSLVLPSIDATIRLSDVYRRIAFPPEDSQSSGA